MRVTVATNPSSEPIKFTSSGGNSGKAHMVIGQGPGSATDLPVSKLGSSPEAFNSVEWPLNTSRIFPHHAAQNPVTLT